MALRKSQVLLPDVFQTVKNNKFLNATVDQLISEPNSQRVNSFIGRKFAPNFTVGDSYVSEIDSEIEPLSGAQPGKVNGGGDEDGFRPMELLLIGLGGCTAMDVISILRKKRQNVAGLELALEADRSDDHPTIFTAIRINYIVRGQEVDPKAVERAISLSETRYCPAMAMLSESVTIELTYEILETQ